MWAGQLSRYSDWLLAGRSGDRIPVGSRFSAPVQTGPGAHPSSCTMGTGFFPRVKSGRGVTLTSHPLLVPLVMKEQSYTSTPPMGRKACTEPQCLYKGYLYLYLYLLVPVFYKITQISNLMKIRPAGAELFHADRRRDMTKLIVAFRSLVNASKNYQKQESALKNRKRDAKLSSTFPVFLISLFIFNPQATNVIYIYMERIFLMFLDHTQRHTTVGRTPLDE